MGGAARCVRSPRAVVGVSAVLIAAALFASLGAGIARGAPSAITIDGVVVRVVDGDTIHVRLVDRIEKVRYIGVNAPELSHPKKGAESAGREAARVNRQLVGGRRVRLELDVQERDRHGRLLAYVWIGNVMVNEELVRLGYAQVITVPPNVRHRATLLARERDARRSGRGLWGS